MGAGWMRAYEARRDRLVADYAALPADTPVRLAKRTSNLFRTRAARTAPGLDVSDFTSVLEVDAAGRTAVVEGMTTYETLVDATLAHGLMPLVVPQLKTITLGGAVTGLGIESSAFRGGLPHESVLSLDVLTGDGRVVTATPENEHRELFYGFANSYGTLGYALRLTIELEPVRPYVRLRHVRHTGAAAFFAEMDAVCASRTYGGEPVDFVDGTIFSGDELYLTLGTFVDAAPYTSDYTGNAIYYRSIQQREVDFLTVRDYLWRWDTDWFWCSRALYVQNPLVRRLVPKRWLRSEVYWKVVAFERRHRWKARWDARRGRPPREDVVQDVEVPVAAAPEYLDFMLREVPIAPLWVCPLRQRDPDVTWTLYDFDPDRLYVNFGFWSSVELAPGEPDGTHNRLIEREVARLDGRKSLYSTSYYDRDEFWRTYHGDAYARLKKEYDEDGRLLDLYAKCVRGQ